jgi:hypothetical protein
MRDLGELSSPMAPVLNRANPLAGRANSFRQFGLRESGSDPKGPNRAAQLDDIARPRDIHNGTVTSHSGM